MNQTNSNSKFVGKLNPNSKLLEIHWNIRKQYIESTKKNARMLFNHQKQSNIISYKNSYLTQQKNIQPLQVLANKKQNLFCKQEIENKLLNMNRYIIIYHKGGLTQKQINELIDKQFLVQAFFFQMQNLIQNQKINPNMIKIVYILSVIDTKELIQQQMYSTDEIFNYLIRNNIVEMVLQIADYLKYKINYFFDQMIQNSISQIIKWCQKGQIQNKQVVSLIKLLKKYFETVSDYIDYIQTSQEIATIKGAVNIQTVNLYFEKLLDILTNQQKSLANYYYYSLATISTLIKVVSIYQQFGSEINRKLINQIIQIGQNLYNNNCQKQANYQQINNCQRGILKLIYNIIINNNESCQQICQNKTIDRYIGSLCFEPTLLNDCIEVLNLFKENNCILQCSQLFQLQKKMQQVQMN